MVRDAVVVGRVVRVDHLPAQDLLVVRTAGSSDAEVLVPFVKAIVPQVDIAAGRVVVTPPAGLFEALPDEPEDVPDAEDGPATDGSSDTEDADVETASEGDDTER